MTVFDKVTDGNKLWRMDVRTEGKPANYDLGLCKWTSSLPHAANNIITFPTFEDMHAHAAAKTHHDVVRNLNGKIIGYFVLKKQMTIIVETEFHSYDVLAARLLCKAESIKLRNKLKKVQPNMMGAMAAGASSLNTYFEQSFSLLTGNICNFTGIQNSVLYLKEGVVTYSAAATTARLEAPPTPGGATSPPLLKIAPLTESSDPWLSLTPPVPPDLVTPPPRQNLFENSSRVARSLFVDFEDDIEGIILDEIDCGCLFHFMLCHALK